MKVEESVVEKLGKVGRIGLTELATLFLPSPPIRVWEEEYENEDENEECDEECEDCGWEDKEKWKT